MNQLAVGRRVTVEVPATSANLGPGFDCFGLALDWRERIELCALESGFMIDVSGEGADEIPRDESHLIIRSALVGLADLGVRAAGLRLSGHNTIPHGRGLGSSSAAIVAGLVAAAGLARAELDRGWLLRHATAIEGHPDNVAASLYGGFVICANGDVTSIEPPSGLEAVAVVPNEPVSTAAARAALPAEVPLTDARFNVAHASVLTLGLARGDLTLIGRGLEDRLHQPRREHLYPRSMELVSRARELGAVGATISGAGPTVLFWVYFENTGALVDRLRGEISDWAEISRLNFVLQGADVEAL